MINKMSREAGHYMNDERRELLKFVKCERILKIVREGYYTDKFYNPRTYFYFSSPRLKLVPKLNFLCFSPVKKNIHVCKVIA